MIRLVLPLLFIFCVGLTGCQTVRLISSEQLATTDFTSPQTFGFAELSKRVKVNRASGEKITAFVEDLVVRRMEERGFQLVEENPDLLLDLRLLLLQRDVEQRSQYRDWSNVYWRRTYGYRYNWRDEDVSVSGNMEANITLTTALASGPTKLWTGKVNTQLSPKKTVVRLTEAVDLIVASWLGE